MGYGAGMTGKEAAGDDEPDANIAMNEIHVVSDEVYMPDELSTSPDGKFLFYFTLLNIHTKLHSHIVLVLRMLHAFSIRM